jgi:hypothetical protein
MSESYLGYLYGKAGDIEKAHKILDALFQRSKREYFSPYMMAIIYAGLGDKDKVFEWLDKAYETRDAAQLWIKIDLPFADLHSDPRWAEQMKKRGLAG